MARRTGRRPGAAPDSASARDQRAELDAQLEAAGLRHSRRRDTVVDVFLASRGHTSVDELVAHLAGLGMPVGRTTVYRTMKLLTRFGVAAAHHFGDGQTRYEAARGGAHHDHLVCEGCGKVEEFSDAELEQAQEAIARRHGFALEGHVFELHGRCRTCRAQGRPGPTR